MGLTQIVKFRGVRTPKTLNRLTKNWRGRVGDYVSDDFPHAKTQNVHWGRGGVCVKYRVVFSDIYISRLYYNVSVRLSVRLSVCH